MICTSLEPNALACEEDLLRFYHAQLTSELEARFGDSAAFSGYAFEEFMEDYRVAFLDYAR